MNAPLDIHEQILLSAWLDGEVSDSERAQVQQLLTRPEAQAYLQSLKSTRVLVNKHGAVKAPVGLKGRVLAAMDEDFDDISRPTASRDDNADGKIIALPTASWKTPLLALAAAIVVVLGLAFGPSLFPTTPEKSPSDIARETAQRAAEKSGEAGEKAGKSSSDELAEKEGPKASGTYGDEALATKLKDATELERSRKEPEPESPAKDPSTNSVKPADEGTKNTDGGTREKEPSLGANDRMERRNESGPAGKKPESRGATEDKIGTPKTGRVDDATPPAPQPPAAPRPAETAGPEDAKDGAKEDAKEDAKKDAKETNDANKAAKEEADALRKAEAQPAEGTDQKPQHDAEGGEQKKLETTPGGGGAGGRTAKPRQDAGKQPGTEGEDAQEDANDDAANEKGATGRAWGEGEAQGAAAATVIELALQPGRALAAQNDVLRVAALYGKAEVTVDEATGTETVVVDLDQARAAELVAALKRLAEQQDYGRVTVPEAMREQVAKAAGASSETARDSLPSDVKVQIDGAQPKDGAAQQARTRLVIQLK